MGAAVVHWEVRTRDAERMKKFYGDLFGWAIDSGNPMNYGLVNTGLKTGIGGGIGAGDSNFTAGVTFYVQVEDLQEHLNRVEATGGRTIMPPTEIPGMVTMALFSDPEGNVVGLVKGPQKDEPPAARRRPPAGRKATTRKRSKPKTKGKKRTRR